MMKHQFLGATVKKIGHHFLTVTRIDRLVAGNGVGYFSVRGMPKPCEWFWLQPFHEATISCGFQDIP